MKFLIMKVLNMIVILLIGVVALSACSTSSNNGYSEKQTEQTSTAGTQNQPVAVESTQSTEPVKTEGVADSKVANDVVDNSATATTSANNNMNEAMNDVGSEPSESSGKDSKTPTPAPTPPPVKSGDKVVKSSKSSPVAEKPASKEYVVEIVNFNFSPNKIEIHVGDTVKFVNRDSIRHTATATDMSFDSDLLGQDESKTFTFNKEGEINYACKPHPGMKGSIIVTAN
ncbi:cupredoxin domain-containing protein [Paenibacillus monticola]|uniref:EfeO-type cupredoxin-like domain-containing protein n=1 Tax=Paenibacillus monticola TaxID=2666075 RepID=A0A7X2L453_9BACL|nr:cupredoxin family copper-binding protein [Paenibacillus monticola]MRN55041.1 hypothetical protein [Paenibacillus monticola]